MLQGLMFCCLVFPVVFGDYSDLQVRFMATFGSAMAEVAAPAAAEARQSAPHAAM